MTLKDNVGACQLDQISELGFLQLTLTVWLSRIGMVTATTLKDNVEACMLVS